MWWARWITGLTLAALVLMINFLLPAFYFCLLIFIVASIAEFELLGILFPSRPERRYVLMGMALSCFVLIVSLTGSSEWFFRSVTVGLMGCMLFHLFAFQRIETAHVQAGKQVLALSYVPLLGGVFVLIRLFPQGEWWLTLGMLVVFAGDTGALYTGKTFGKHRLYPSVSPKKTVEGGLGGLLFSVGFGLLFRTLFFPNAPLAESIGLFAVLAVFGQVGDLFESLIKRAGGVKDSGRILPGHGGMLDRIDGALFAALPLYLYLTCFRAGGL